MTSLAVTDLSDMNFNATPSQDLAEGGYVITVTATRPLILDDHTPPV